jgi:hypothetical protein
MVTEGWDVYTGLFSGFQDGRPFLYLNLFSINCKFDHNKDSPLHLFSVDLECPVAAHGADACGTDFEFDMGFNFRPEMRQDIAQG